MAAPLVAEAAPPNGNAKPPTGARSSTQFTLRREEAGGPNARTARQRMRAGDCAGAIPAFDEAIRVTIEPTLRRDRGLCHEKLDEPYPAIDDYRAYLMARPDAPDADQIRDRLGRLEEQVGVGGRSKTKHEDEEPSSVQASGEASFSMNGSSASPSASAGSKKTEQSEVLGPRAGEQEKSYDYYRKQEDAEESAANSSLRYGDGFILGAYLMMPRYFFNKNGASDLAYGVGLSLRYSTGPTVTLIADVGYGGIGDVGSDGALGGPTVFLGAEARLPFTKYASDQIVLGGGGDFERLVVSRSKVGGNLWGLRLRGGYRHVFGPQFAIEAMVDGGYGSFVLQDGSQGMGSLGGYFGVLVGF
ncbi:hypothetical protein AKJ09_09961 [Labilithrix luteola]|uniref:Tetratricopeptide repeat protein n=1 Tax=Labilithrix luteola TaxID=1391654 RepID=A0A0K1QC47_9BACT|nr:hypothetical protein AKJ09_09961 [Labilithrix luteola]